MSKKPKITTTQRQRRQRQKRQKRQRRQRAERKNRAPGQQRRQQRAVPAVGDVVRPTDMPEEDAEGLVIKRFLKGHEEWCKILGLHGCEDTEYPANKLEVVDPAGLQLEFFFVVEERRGHLRRARNKEIKPARISDDT